MTTHLILFQSSHTTLFQLLKVYLQFPLQIHLKGFPVTVQQASFFFKQEQSQSFPSKKKNKNSIPVSGKYMKSQQTRHLEGEPRNRPTVY